MTLSIATVMGIGLSIISFIAMLIIIRILFYQDSADEWPSLASMILFLSGIQLSCIGILGEYLAKIYIETKNRPLYVTKEDNLKKRNK